jgi:hypothetical protein
MLINHKITYMPGLIVSFILKNSPKNNVPLAITMDKQLW